MMDLSVTIVLHMATLMIIRLLHLTLSFFDYQSYGFSLPLPAMVL